MTEVDTSIVPLKSRFRGFYPVVIDVETGGFNAATDALLEVGVCLIEQNEQGELEPGESLSIHVTPFEGAHLCPEALAFNKINVDHPFRFAISEDKMLEKLFNFVRPKVKAYQCNRAVLVGHNAWFDLSFINAAIERVAAKRSPFHSFTSFDTATMGALLHGQTVLARLLHAQSIPYDTESAHSAIYDAKITADAFCKMVNQVPLIESKSQENSSSKDPI